jgi:cytochrome c556
LFDALFGYPEHCLIRIARCDKRLSAKLSPKSEADTMKMSVRSTLFAVAVGVGVLGTAVGASAQAPEIAARQELMKANGAALRVLVPMVRGEAPWNAAAAGQAATTVQNDAVRAKPMFPAGSTAANSAALPAIWERKAEFDAIFDRQRDAAANLVRLAAAGDEAGFKAAFPALGQTCGACHTPFRRPAN